MADRSLFAFNLTNKNPLDYAGALHSLPYTLFLDSADRTNPQSRYSFIAFAPFETIESKNGRVTVSNADQQLSFIRDPFKILDQRMNQWGIRWQSRTDLPPFQGGAAGSFGYDLARHIEHLPSRAGDNRAMPDMMVGLYDQVLAFDHQKDKAWFIIHAASNDAAQARLTWLRKTLDSASPVIADPQHADFQPLSSRAEYEAKVLQVIRYVHAGDIFQANLSQCFIATLDRKFDSFAHYLHLRDVNAAPFGAYMNFGDIRLSSASPERFLSVTGRDVETRPIKGTRLRHADPDMDRRVSSALLSSQKDRAENAMIVDLLRNDLSRACMDHSIDVPILCGLESFARVHHLVSVVKGQLSADKTPLDLLRVCFPGGSITGAPKVRAMEIIEELEDDRRGPYCGALGYIGFNGMMDTNIAIRTIVYQGRQASFNAGGGIVADSIPSDEYEETLMKAEGLLRSFGAQDEERICA